MTELSESAPSAAICRSDTLVCHDLGIIFAFFETLLVACRCVPSLGSVSN